MSKITILKAKETEWLIVNNKVEENLTRLSEKNKASILSAVARRLGNSGSSFKTIRTTLPIKQKEDVFQILRGVNHGL